MNVPPMTQAGRPLPSWATPEQSETFNEAMKALATYKKRDPSDKGVPHILISRWAANSPRNNF